MLDGIASKPAGIFSHGRFNRLLTIRAGRYRFLFLHAGLIGPDADAVSHTAILRVSDIMIHKKLDLLANQRGCLGVAEQLSQRLSIGRIDDQRPDLHNARHTFFRKGKHVLIFLATLERHGSIPEAGNREYRLHTVIDVFGSKIFGFPHLAKALISGQLAQSIFRHHDYIPPFDLILLE